MPWNVRKFVHNQLGEVNLSSDLGRVDPWARSDWSHTDIPRLRAGLVGAQVSSTLHSLDSPYLFSPSTVIPVTLFGKSAICSGVSTSFHNFYVNSCYVTYLLNQKHIVLSKIVNNKNYYLALCNVSHQ